MALISVAMFLTGIPIHLFVIRFLHASTFPSHSFILLILYSIWNEYTQNLDRTESANMHR